MPDELIGKQAALNKKILELVKGRKELEIRANDKANAIGEYRKKLAITIIKLKNGVEFELDGEKIKSPPATITMAIAHGICFKEKIAMELAESRYKNAIVGLETLRAELNGIQSSYRHLDESEGVK